MEPRTSRCVERGNLIVNVGRAMYGEIREENNACVSRKRGGKSLSYLKYSPSDTTQLDCHYHCGRRICRHPSLNPEHSDNGRVELLIRFYSPMFDQ